MTSSLHCTKSESNRRSRDSAIRYCCTLNRKVQCCTLNHEDQCCTLHVNRKVHLHSFGKFMYSKLYPAWMFCLLFAGMACQRWYLGWYRLQLCRNCHFWVRMLQLNCYTVVHESFSNVLSIFTGNISVHFHIYCGPFFRHADGSVKFWDGSASTLQLLYKLKTNKVFEKPSSSSMRARWRSKSGTDGSRGQDDPFAIEHIYFCVDSRLLCVAGQDHVTLFRFSKQEVVTECSVSASSRLHAMFSYMPTTSCCIPPHL